jgi:hypothetical protein
MWHNAPDTGEPEYLGPCVVCGMCEAQTNYPYVLPGGAILCSSCLIHYATEISDLDNSNDFEPFPCGAGLGLEVFSSETWEGVTCPDCLATRPDFEKEQHWTNLRGGGVRNELDLDYSTDRHKEICEWLKSSKYALPFKRGNGFHITYGKIVKLKNGDQLDLLVWLMREGFYKLKRCGNYLISYTLPDNNYSEKYSFLFSQNFYQQQKNIEFDKLCQPDPYWSDSSTLLENWERSHPKK